MVIMTFQVGVVQHFVARALCLIILPTLMYIAVFAVHLKIFNHRSVTLVNEIFTVIPVIQFSTLHYVTNEYSIVQLILHYVTNECSIVQLLI